MQPIDSIETYAYGARKYLASEKRKVKCNNIMKRYKNDQLEDVTKENIK